MSKKILAAAIAASLCTACSSYEFGDISKRYCEETDPVLQAALKKQIVAIMGELPADYCLVKTIVVGQ